MDAKPNVTGYMKARALLTTRRGGAPARLGPDSERELVIDNLQVAPPEQSQPPVRISPWDHALARRPRREG